MYSIVFDVLIKILRPYQVLDSFKIFIKTLNYIDNLTCDLLGPYILLVNNSIDQIILIGQTY